MEIVNTTEPDTPTNSTPIESREVLEGLLSQIAKKKPSLLKIEKKNIFTRLVISAYAIVEFPEAIPYESYNIIGRAILHYAERLGEGEDEGNELSLPTMRATVDMLRRKEICNFIFNLCTGFTQDNFFKLLLDYGKIVFLLPQNAGDSNIIINSTIEKCEGKDIYDRLTTKSYLKLLSKNIFGLEFYRDNVLEVLFKNDRLSQNALDSIADFITELWNSDVNTETYAQFVKETLTHLSKLNDISRNFVSNVLIPRLNQGENSTKTNCFYDTMWELLKTGNLPEDSKVNVFKDILDKVKNTEITEGENIKPGVINETIEKYLKYFSDIAGMKNVLKRETILEAITAVCVDITSGSVKILARCQYTCLCNLVNLLDPDEGVKRILNEHQMLRVIMNETFSYAKAYEEKFRESNSEDLGEYTYLYGYGSFREELNSRLRTILAIIKNVIDTEENNLFAYEIWNNLFVGGFCEYERKLVACWIGDLLKGCVQKGRLFTLMKPSINKIGESIRTMPPALIASCSDVFRFMLYFENEGVVGIDTITKASPVLCSYQPTTVNTLKMYDLLWKALATIQHFLQQHAIFSVLLELSNGSEPFLLWEYGNRVRALNSEEHQDELVSLIRFYNEYFVVKHLKEKRENKLFSDNQNGIIKHYATTPNTNTIDITCTFMNTKADFVIKDVNPFLTDVYTLQRRVTSFLERLNSDVREKYDVTQLRFKVVPNGPEFSAIDYHDAGFAFLSDQNIGITNSVKVEVSAVDKTIIDQEMKNGGSANNNALERLGNKNYNGVKDNRNTIINYEKELKVPRKLAIALGIASIWNSIDVIKSGYLKYEEFYSQKAIALRDEDVIFEEDTDEEIEKIIKDNNEIAKKAKTTNTYTAKASQFFRGPKQIVEVYDAETLRNKLSAFNVYDYERTLSGMTETLISLLDSEYEKVSNAAWQSLRFVPIPKSLTDNITKDENALEEWINASFPPEKSFKGLYLLSILRYVLSTDFLGKFSQENVKEPIEEYMDMTESIIQSYDPESMSCEEVLQGALSNSFGSLVGASEGPDNEQLVISYIHVLLMGLCRGYLAESSLYTLREIFSFIASKEELANATNAKCFGTMVMVLTIQSFEKTQTLNEAKAIASNIPFLKLGLRCAETAVLCSKLIENICSAVVRMEGCRAETKVEFLGGLVSEMFKWMDDLYSQQFYDSLLASLGSLMKFIPEGERTKYSHYPETILNAAVAIADGTDTNTSNEHVIGIFKLFETVLNYYRDLLNSTQEGRAQLKKFAFDSYKKYISGKGEPEVRNAVMPIVSNICRNDNEITQELFAEALPDIENGVKGSKFVTDRGFWEYYPGYEKTIAKKEEEDRDKYGNKRYPGLKNMGNTCYMNSVLQQLYHIAPFRKAIINIDLSLINPEPKSKGLVEKLKVLFESMDDRRNINETVKNFIDTIASLPFEVHRQQDADEFIGLLFDKIETALKDTQYWNEIRHIFGGEYLNTFTNPEGKITKAEPFRNVQVPVAKDVCTGFEELIKPEELETKAIKTTVYTTLPPTLTIQLKRFTYSTTTGSSTKNNSTIRLPETLDMTKYMDASELENVDPALMRAYSQYKLRGVILHQGENISCGHYLSYIKADKIEDNSGSRVRGDSSWNTFNEREREWMCFNDERVSTLSKYDIDHLMKEGWANEYGKPSSYILFYERELVPSADGVLLPYCEIEAEGNEMEIVNDEEPTGMTDDEMQRISHTVFSDEHLNFIFALCKDAAPLVVRNDETKEILLRYFMNVVIRSKQFDVMRGWNDIIREHLLRKKEDAERFVRYLIQTNLVIKVLGEKSCDIVAEEFEKVVMQGISLLIEDEREALNSICAIDGKSQDELPLLVKFFGDIVKNINNVNINTYHIYLLLVKFAFIFIFTFIIILYLLFVVFYIQIHIHIHIHIYIYIHTQFTFIRKKSN